MWTMALGGRGRRERERKREGEGEEEGGGEGCLCFPREPWLLKTQTPFKVFSKNFISTLSTYHVTI